MRYFTLTLKFVSYICVRIVVFSNICLIITLRKLNFERTNFREKIFKKAFLIFARINFHGETYFKYFVRIKYYEFRHIDILLVVVFFRMRLENVFTRLTRDLIFAIQKINSLKLHEK